MKTFTHSPASRSQAGRRRPPPSAAAATRRSRRSQRRPDDRVRPAEAPQHARRPAPLRGEPGTERSGVTHPGERYCALCQMRPMLDRLPRHRRRPALRRSARLPRRRHGGLLLALHPAADRAGSSSSSPAVCRDRRGAPWAMASLAAHPGGAVRAATLPDARPPRRGSACAAGGRVPRRRATRCASTSARRRARRRVRASRCRGRGAAFGGSGLPRRSPASASTGTRGCCAPRVERQRGASATSIDLDGADAYAEKNWGAGGMPPAWWWGQAHGFEREDVCVAFAGGRAGLGPLRMPATALVVAVGDEVRSVVRPLRPLRVAVDERGWRLAGGGIEVEGEADGGVPHLLPVPVPPSAVGATSCGAPASRGHARLSVRRGGRTIFAGHLASWRASSRGAGTSADGRPGQARLLGRAVPRPRLRARRRPARAPDRGRAGHAQRLDRARAVLHAVVDLGGLRRALQPPRRRRARAAAALPGGERPDRGRGRGDRAGVRRRQHGVRAEPRRRAPGPGRRARRHRRAGPAPAAHHAGLPGLRGAVRALVCGARAVALRAVGDRDRRRVERDARRGPRGGAPPAPRPRPVGAAPADPRRRSTRTTSPSASACS